MNHNSAIREREGGEIKEGMPAKGAMEFHSSIFSPSVRSKRRAREMEDGGGLGDVYTPVSLPLPRPCVVYLINAFVARGRNPP